MSHMIIDGRKVEFTDEKNILSVIRKAGINIPTLCYHSELSTFGACRLCRVENVFCRNWHIVWGLKMSGSRIRENRENWI